MAKVVLKNVQKSYGDTLIIKNANFEIDSGEFVVFVGPSGSGKSTLLRSIAGLENINAGSILIDGTDVSHVSPSKRGIAMVFQSYALYPHMNVFDNMAFALKLSNVDKDEIKERVAQAAASLNMSEYLDRLPKNLSGGQRQRVAIGRAIVRKPKVFLFDEPLSNLDAALRAKTRIEIAKLHKSVQATMLYVTHDQVEAMTLADRIVVLKDGEIQQIGTPTQLYKAPHNRFVAGFIGSPTMNFIKATCEDNKLLVFNKSVPLEESLDNASAVYELGVRPENLFFADKQHSLLSGKIELIENLGEYALYYVALANGDTITLKSALSDELRVDSSVEIGFEQKNIHLFDKNEINLRANND